MADLFWEKGYQFFDDSGNPLNAGTINVYDAGTLSERTVYQDDGEATPWTQPITLNSAGRLTASVYIPTGDWKFILKNSSGSTIATEDNIPGAVTIPSATYAAPRTTILTKASNYTIVVGDLGKKVEVDASGGDVTITLIAAASATSGDQLWIQNVGATGRVIIDGNGAETIDGSATLTLRGQYDSVILVTDTVGWKSHDFQKFRATLAKTADYTVLPADWGKLLTGDATSASFTFTLPTVATAGAGYLAAFAKIDSSANTVTLDGDGSETIDGATTYVLRSQYDKVVLRCDGTGWQIVSGFVTSTTSGKGLVELATDAEAQAITDATRAVTPANLAAMVATQANQETGTANDRFVTPGRQHYHPSAAKGWATADAAGAATASYNLTSITDVGAGQVTFNWATDFSSADYTAVGTMQIGSNTTVQALCHGIEHTTYFPTAGTTSMFLYRTAGDTSVVYLDPQKWHMAVYGDQ